MDLERGLLEILLFLEKANVPYMVIGGFANLVWGVPRTTQDLDITISIAEEKLSEFLARVTQTFLVLPEDPQEFIRQTRVLPLETSNGLRIDLILAGLPYEEAAIRRARKVEIQGHSICVCSPEDLVIHKIVSERPRDREDVEGIFRQQGGNLDFGYLDPIIYELGKALEKPEIVEFYETIKQTVLYQEQCAGSREPKT